jgi:hypothetical protein
MVEFVRRGGYFERNALIACHVCSNREDAPSLIQIANIEGELFVHDGHHRVIAVALAKRHLIFDAELTVTKYTWEDYTKANIAKKWYTPFDPRTEVRLADLTRFRKMMANTQEFEELQLFTIKNFAHLYKTERTYKNVYEMADDDAISQYRMS